MAAFLNPPLPFLSPEVKRGTVGVCGGCGTRVCRAAALTGKQTGWNVGIDRWMGGRMVKLS